MQGLGLGIRLQQETVLQDSLKTIKTKINLMMKLTNIQINSLASVFQDNNGNEVLNAGARNRVALEEEDSVKLDRWMTEPVQKVKT